MTVGRSIEIISKYLKENNFNFKVDHSGGHDCGRIIIKSQTKIETIEDLHFYIEHEYPESWMQIIGIARGKRSRGEGEGNMIISYESKVIKDNKKINKKKLIDFVRRNVFS